MWLRIRSALKENRSFFLFVALMLVFRSAVADWNDVPTGSMNPTIVEGDRVFVNKMAYDIRIPFTLHSIKKRSDPKRGDIIVFESAVADKRLIKRVVGVPGDKVLLRDNVLFINGEQVRYAKVRQSVSGFDMEEDLLGVVHKIRVHQNTVHQVGVSQRSSVASSFDEVYVPRGYYLALGDNRDNSADSRVIGLVPRNEIIGRSRHVVFSLDYDNYLIPRRERFFQRL